MILALISAALLGLACGMFTTRTILNWHHRQQRLRALAETERFRDQALDAERFRLRLAASRKIAIARRRLRSSVDAGPN